MSVLGSFNIGSDGENVDPVNLGVNNYFTGANTFVQPVGLNVIAPVGTAALNKGEMRDGVLATYARLDDPNPDFDQFSARNVFTKNPLVLNGPIADADLSTVGYINDKFAVTAGVQINAANTFTAQNTFDQGIVATTLNASGQYAYYNINTNGPVQFNGDLDLGASSFAGNLTVTGNMKTAGVTRTAPYNSLSWDVIAGSEIVTAYNEPAMTYEIYTNYGLTARVQQITLAVGTPGQKVVIINRNTSQGSNIYSASGSGSTRFFNKLVATYPFVMPRARSLQLIYIGAVTYLGVTYNTCWQVMTFPV